MTEDLIQNLNKEEKEAVNEFLAAARQIYKREGLEKVATFDKWIKDIAAEIVKIKAK